MPNRFVPAGEGSSLEEMRKVMNASFAQLDAEAVTKKFGGNTGTTMSQGILQDGRIGILMQVNGVDRQFVGLYQDGRFGIIGYDENGIPISLDGMAPDDGRINKWVVKPGENVLTELGG